MSIFNIQPSFAGGELAPTLWGRTDLAKYAVGLKRCENFIIQPHGGATRRPGMEFITLARGDCRLFPFIYNQRDSYVLEFSDKRIRFFKAGKPVLKNGVPYEVTTPYPENVLFALKFAQSADTLFIAHRGYPPAKLVRYNDTNWQWSELIIDAGPFRQQSDAESRVKLQASATSGTVTITSSAGLFNVNNVGQLVELTQQVDELHYKEARDAKTLTETSSVTFNGVPSVAYCSGNYYEEYSGGGDGGDGGGDGYDGWDSTDTVDDTPETSYDGVSDDSGMAGTEGVESGGSPW